MKLSSCLENKWQFWLLKEIAIIIVISEFLERHSKAKRTRAPAYSRALKERVAANDLDEDKCTSKLSNVSIFHKHDLVYLQIIQIIFLLLHTSQLFRIKINYLEENLQLEIIDLKC